MLSGCIAKNIGDVFRGSIFTNVTIAIGKNIILQTNYN